MPTDTTSDRVVILLHGMGYHPESHDSEDQLTFEQEVLKATKNASERYKSVPSFDFNKKVIVEPIYYDHIFEKHRKEIADNATGIEDYIKAHIPNVLIPGALQRLIDFEKKLGGDKFAYTHVLDVILYLTLVGGDVRAHVAAEMGRIIREHNSKRISVVAHSLGTAVAHDVMDMIFTDSDTDEKGKFPISSHKIDTYWAFANVSDVVSKLSGKKSPRDTIVKPGDNGCLGSFRNVYNEWDPFVLEIFFRFAPQETDQDWIDPALFQIGAFKNIELNKVSRKNTHSIFGYLEDPDVCHRFFKSFFEFKPTDEDKTKGDALYKNVESEVKKIADFLREIDSYKDIVTFIKMIKDFEDFIR